MNELLFILGPLAMAAGVGVAVWGLVLEKRSTGTRRDAVGPDTDAEAPKPADTRPTTRIMACPGCGRRLRLPMGGGGLRVTCPGCRHAFDVRPN